MAKLTRVTQKIFASAAGLDQVAQFGSLAAGSPAFTTDPAVVQSLSNWLTGWFGAVIGGNAPAIEDMNAVLFVFAYQLAYAMQEGVAEWDAGTTYYIGSIVNDGSGVLYVSRTDTNLNNLVSDATNWKKIGGAVMTTLGDTTYGGAAGAMTRLPGNTSATPAMMTQIGDGLGSSAPPVWTPILAPTVQKFLTGSGTYTTPAGVLYIRVRMVGGGGGGASGGASGYSNGNTGANTTFGTTLLIAGAGAGGPANSIGGAGGSFTVNSPAVDVGSKNGILGGGAQYVAAEFTPGGAGGSTPFGGGGGGGIGGDGNSAVANTGAGGGGGCGTSGDKIPGAGGGAGAFVDALIKSPSATYSYSVGTGGAAVSAGTSGTAGGAGGSGVIIVEEFYQ